MKYWRKYHPEINVDDPRYHQVSLIYSILLIMLAYFSVIGLLNVTLFDAAHIAVYDFSGFVLIAGIYFYVSRGSNFTVAGWLVTGTLIFVLLAFIHLAEGRNYSLIWVTILPPIAFFLHGPRAGTWVTGIVFAYCGWFLYEQLSRGVPGDLSLGAFLNFIEVATAQLFLFRYYERSRREAYEQLQATSVTDPLTGLYNRLHLDVNLNMLLSSSRHKDLNLSVLLIDVDHFKKINDEYGHLMGDRVLCSIATILKEAVRECDFVGRWGGEEFLVVCPETGSKEAMTLANRIVETIQSRPLVESIHATVSIGVAEASNNTNLTAEGLLHLADKNLYMAKSRGRNRAISMLSADSFDNALSNI